MASVLTRQSPESAALPQEFIRAVHETPTQKLQRFTVETALHEGINPAVPAFIVTHESDWQQSAVGDHGLAHNVAQFHKKTFEWMEKKSGMSLHYDSAEDQIVLLTWALKNNLGNNWSTFRLLNKSLE